VPPPTEQRTASSGGRRRPAATNAADAELLAALQATPPVTALPTSLSLGFIDFPDTGAVLTASLHLNATTLDFGSSDGNARQAVVDIVNTVFDDRGQGVSSFKQRLTIRPPAAPATKDAPRTRVTHSHEFRLKPGLYQVRVAARDSKTGRIGSAMEWIEIPALPGGPFAMSSLRGERAPDTSQSEAGRAPHLRFLTYIYNAARSTAPPDVVLKVEVFRDDKRVVATPSSRLKTEGIADLSRIPYLAEVNLEGMPSGRYVLQVTATDRTARADASQRMNFEIE
jgi:hypothetical protein